jgi:hypothetical protein
MRRRLLIAVVFFAMLAAPAAGQMEGIGDAIDRYNGNTEALPGFLGAVIGDQKVNVYINMSDGSQESFAVRMDGLAMDLQESAFANYTIRVTATQDAVVSVMNATDPRTELKERKEAGEITYDTEGFVNGLRMSIVDLVL